MKINRYKLLLLIVGIINVLGTIFGFIYYQHMFVDFPLKFWVFIPDSPLATLLFAVSLFFLYFNKKIDLLLFVASVNSVKYGLWTMMIILYFPGYFLSPAIAHFYYLMFLLHFGMVIQPLLLLHKIKIKAGTLLAGVGWFLLNDYMDYVWGVNSLFRFPFENSEIMAVGYFTVLMSLLIPLLFMYMSEKKRGWISKIWDRLEEF